MKGQEAAGCGHKKAAPQILVMLVSVLIVVADTQTYTGDKNS